VSRLRVLEVVGRRSLPSLIEEVRRLMTPDRKAAAQARGARVAAAHKSAHMKAVEDARHGWDASPVSVPRMIAELGAQIKNDDWAIVSGHQFTGDWQRRERARYWADIIEDFLRAAVRDRDQLPPSRSLDVRFDDFMAAGQWLVSLRGHLCILSHRCN
jgi:hypothetical protein